MHEFGFVVVTPALDVLCSSLPVPTLDGVCRLDTPDGCAAFLARCAAAAATPALARGEVARLHNRWVAANARAGARRG